MNKKNIVAKTKKEVEKYRKKIFKAKQEYRKELAKLPFEKKIEILKQLQKLATEIKNISPFRKRQKF